MSEIQDLKAKAEDGWFTTVFFLACLFVWPALLVWGLLFG
jgi:hypothetical protein